MAQLEPTYLRYIYDGLVKGSIHPNNAAELPDGLIGLYEEAFDERQPVHKRQKLLERFALWALLKKEVSAAFVAEVLGESEDEIHDFIATYSAWFNSPESGKYQLYHERLKVFLLQKLSERELHLLHEKLISRLEKAIEEQKADEFEWYGLEFLTQHYAVNAILKGSGSKLIDLAYNQNHWQRQLKISKGYIWTKSGLHSVMNWASKYNDDEVIECGLQLVDLHNQEQNAAPQIVALVAEGDFNSALKRIEQFGGNDKQGLQRKFILYMLCLMELTLLDSRFKPFRREGIDKILKHLDEHLSTEMEWSEFFSSHLIFHLACEWAELGVDYLIVYKRTNVWNKDWIRGKFTYTKLGYEVTLSCIRLLTDRFEKSKALQNIAVKLYEYGFTDESASVLQESLYFSRSINDDCQTIYEPNDVGIQISSDYQKSISLLQISIILAKYEKIDESKSLMQEALASARKIIDHYEKSFVLVAISIELEKQSQLKKSKLLMKESVDCITIFDQFSFRKINTLKNNAALLYKHGFFEKSELLLQEALSCSNRHSATLKEIAFLLAKLGKVEESLKIIDDIFDESEKINAQHGIAVIKANHGQIEEAIIYAQAINDKFERSYALMGISIEIAKLGQFEKSIDVARGLLNYWDKTNALTEIWIELVQKGQIKKSESVMLEAISNARRITDYGFKFEALRNISVELFTNGYLEESAQILKESLASARLITHKNWRNKAIQEIGMIFFKRGNFEESLFLMLESLASEQGQSKEGWKSDVLKGISSELFKNKCLKESASVIKGSLNFALGMINNLTKDINLNFLAVQMAKQGQLNESYFCVDSIIDKKQKNYALKGIAVELAKNGKVEESLNCAKKILFDESQLCFALKCVAIELSKQGKIKEALECARGIILENEKNNALNGIAIELAKQGQIAESLNCVLGIIDKSEQNKAMNGIAIEFAKNGHLTVSRDCIRDIQDQRIKILARRDLAIVLSKKKQVEESEAFMNESLASVREISDERWKTKVMMEIGVELFQTGNRKKSKMIMQESILYALAINDEWDSSHALNGIAIEFAKQDLMEESFSCVEKISDDFEKSDALRQIAEELAKIGHIEVALDCARAVKDKMDKIYALEGVAAEMVRQGHWFASLNAALEIDKTSRQSCLKNIASTMIEVDGLEDSLAMHCQSDLEEFKTIFLEEWVKNVSVSFCSKQLILNSIKYIKDDLKTLSLLLQKYALHKLFFENSSEKEIERFNRSLAIHWAIDIKNQIKAI